MNINNIVLQKCTNLSFVFLMQVWKRILWFVITEKEIYCTEEMFNSRGRTCTAFRKLKNAPFVISCRTGQNSHVNKIVVIFSNVTTVTFTQQENIKLAFKEFNFNDFYVPLAVKIY